MNKEVKGLSSEEYEGIYRLKEEPHREFGEGIDLILFGSKARGDSTPDSDIDILVLVNGDLDSILRDRILNTSYNIELEYNSLLLRPLVLSRRVWETNKDDFSFGINVQREGVQI